MESEVEFHIEQETRFNIERGMPAGDARRAALIAFGGRVQMQEEVRDAWGVQFWSGLRRDFAFSWRSLRKDKGYALLAIVTLALGIGANTALFSVIRSVVLRPLPVSEGDRLVTLAAVNPASGQRKVRFSYPELKQLRERTQLLDKVEELHTMTFTLLGRSEPQNVQTGVVPADYFDFLGVRPLYGRGFLPGEDTHKAEPVLVLSYRYFMTSFGGDTKVVGSTVRLNDRVHTIVGVLPPLPEFPQPIDVYMPLMSCPTRGGASFEQNKRASLLQLFGRTKPGVTASQVQSEFDGIFASYREQARDVYPANVGFKGNAKLLRDELSQQARPTLYLLFAITGMVLLIACASVANLSVARMLRREREIAIRAAIGGSRRQLMQQFVIEGLMIAVTGGALGLAGADSVLHLLKAFVARLTPRAGEIGLDVPVLLFCLGVSVVTGVVFCALPAWRNRIDLVSATKDGSATSTAGVNRQSLRRTLVSAQVAFSFVVLISAGLLMRSFINLARVDLGFQPQHVVSMILNPNWTHVNTADKFQRFYSLLLERIRNTPGVVAAGVTGNIPLAQSGSVAGGLVIEGNGASANDPPVQMNLSVASPGYFETLRIPILSGRAFTDADRADRLPVAVVDATMAKRRWPGQDPIGRRVRVVNREQWITVVGIAGDVRAEGLERDPGEQIYFPLAQGLFGTDLVVRTAGDTQSLIRDLRSVVYQIDPEQAIASVQTMEDIVGENLAAPQLTTKLVGLLALLTLIITIAGISGVASVSTDQRRPEMGIRLALGAAPAGLIRMIVRQEMTMVVVGLILGLIASVGAGRALARFLFGTPPHDAFTLSVAAGLMLCAAGLACLIPALRAAHVDPIQVLRRE